MLHKKAAVMILAAAVFALISSATAFSAVDFENAVTNVASRVGPAVVTITMERTGRLMVFGPGRYYFKAFANKPRDPFEDFFQDYFGNLPEAVFKQQGLGSGLIIHPDGYVLTNQHVIEGADKISVMLPDGRSFEGKVLGEDRRDDLAVIKIGAGKLAYADLGDSDVVKTGQWVVAIGNPFGHIVKSSQPTVTAGVISALHRSLPMFGSSADRNFKNLIQTDAAINEGNSGGPLCDLAGKVIGINTTIFSQGGGNIGISFAIPINTAKAALYELVSGKDIIYGSIGVAVQDMTQAVANYFGLLTTEGALVVTVQEDDPAYKAGIKAGDIIKKYDGYDVKNSEEFLDKVNETRVGKTVAVDIIRDQKYQSLDVHLETKPKIEARAEKRAAQNAEEVVVEWRGIKVSGITDKIAGALNLDNKSGVVIVEVMPDSAARAVGLRPGDVVREINRREITALDVFKSIIDSSRGNVLVKTDRGYYITKEGE